jgi:hypothetical protein
MASALWRGVAAAVVYSTPNSMSSRIRDRGTPSSQRMMGMVISLKGEEVVKPVTSL